MPNIKPVSDLRNYGKVLEEVTVGEPVFLTKNGRGKYAVLDMEEFSYYQKMLAKERLMQELEKGRKSGEETGWIPLDEAFTILERNHENG